MLGLSAAVRVDLATKSADRRRSFDGLAVPAWGSLRLEPLSGHLFVFVHVTIVADPIPSITTSGPHLELMLSDERRIASAPGFGPQTLRRLIAVVEGPSCWD